MSIQLSLGVCRGLVPGPCPSMDLAFDPQVPHIKWESALHYLWVSLKFQGICFSYLVEFQATQFSFSKNRFESNIANNCFPISMPYSTQISETKHTQENYFSSVISPVEWTLLILVPFFPLTIEYFKYNEIYRPSRYEVFRVFFSS